MLCPICLEFPLVEREELNEVTYRGRYSNIHMEYSTCPQCGDQGNYEQMKRNKDRMNKFKDTIDLWSSDMGTDDE